MRVWIFLRNTEDWGNMNLTKVLYNSKLSMSGECTLKSSSCEFAKGVHQFNSTFSMSFFEFRKRIKELAMSTWMKIPFIQEDDEKLVETISDDDFVLPIDDDDWIHPEFEEILKTLTIDQIGSLNQSCFCLREKRVVSDVRGVKNLLWSGARNYGSCQVVFRGSLLKNCSKNLRTSFLRRHESIGIASKNNSIPIDYMKTNDPFLTCYVNHLANHNKLSWNGGFEEDVMIESLKTKKIQIEDGFMWVKPYVEKMMEICNEIEVKRSHKDFNWFLI